MLFPMFPSTNHHDSRCYNIKTGGKTLILSCLLQLYNLWATYKDHQLNVRSSNTEGVIKNGQYREPGNIGYTKRRKTKQKHNTICDGFHYAETNTNSVNKTWALLQTTGGKDEPKKLDFLTILKNLPKRCPTFSFLAYPYCIHIHKLMVLSS